MAFHADFVGLHMLQVERCLHHRCFMHLLTVLSCSFLPSRYGALIQPECVHNRLPRTPGAEQGADHHDQLFCLAQALKHGPLMRAEGLSARPAFLSLALFSMTHQVACPDFPSCRTLLIGAK